MQTNRQVFRKSGIYQNQNTGTFGRDYQDPTRLSFILLFDWHSSPLLSANDKSATMYYKSLIKNLKNPELTQKYVNKFLKLRAFLQALNTINAEMPWYWQSLSGLNEAVDIDEINPYKKDKELKISTLETINLPILTMFEYYRDALFDRDRNSFILPQNLIKFDLYVYVTEALPIDVDGKDKGILQNIENKFLNGFVNSTKIGGMYSNLFNNLNTPNPIEDKMKTPIIAENRPVFFVKLSKCEFKFNSGTANLAEINNAVVNEPATNEITITYERVKEVGAQGLNGIVDLKSLNMGKEFKPIEEPTVNGYLDYGAQLMSRINGMNPINMVEKPANPISQYNSKFDNEALNFHFYTMEEHSQDFEKDAEDIINAMNKPFDLSTIGSNISNSLLSMAQGFISGGNQLTGSNLLNGVINSFNRR